MVAFKSQILQKQNYTEIATYVRIGMLSKKCKGFGICEIQALPENYQEKTAYKQVVCNISKITDDSLVFSFFPDTMSAEQEKYYFDRSDFTLGEDFVMSNNITRALDLESFLLKRGSYKKYIIGSAHNIIFSSA